VHNETIIHLTELGENRARHLADREFGDVRDDIVSYLIAKPGYKAACEEIGMNIKVLGPELKEYFMKLEKEGYIAEQHLEPEQAHGRYSPEHYESHKECKEDDENHPAWKCQKCGADNRAKSSDPRSVECEECGEHHTVTGRDIHGHLYVQHFAMR